MLIADKITKFYGRQAVLSRATIEVGSEIKALIGINGSGKSTLLKIVAGIVPADSGTVSLNGQNVTRLPPEKRRLGYVPQHPALFQHLSVRDNVLYCARNGMGSAAAYEQVVGMLGLGAVLDKRPRELSGGYKSRVSLARALVAEPELLLMDEPLNDMDVVLRERILPVFRGVLRQLKIPVLYVTHDPREAELMADIFTVIDRGGVHQVRTAAQAFELIRTSILQTCYT